MNPPTHAQVVRRALLRTVGVSPLWLARLVAGASTSAWALTLGLDVSLLAAHWWSVAPLRRFERDKYPSLRDHATQLWAPFAFALFLLVRDLLRVFSNP